MILYGIKNCDTVKKARKYLDNKNANYSYHDFRDDGLSVSKVEAWLSIVGIDILVNKRSTTWKKLTDAQKQSVDVRLICDNPTLIKRPVLEISNEVIVGYKEAEYEVLMRLKNNQSSVPRSIST